MLGIGYNNLIYNVVSNITSLFINFISIMCSFDPIPFWAAGVQICALNYQVGDASTQLNYGKFLENNNCGYVSYLLSTSI